MIISIIVNKVDYNNSYMYVYKYSVNIYIYYIPPPLTVHFPIMHTVRYQPILHTTVIKMVEMVEILDGRLVSIQLSE